MTASPAPGEGAAWKWEDLQTGLELEHEYLLSESVMEGFVALFGDRSAVHVDLKAAASRGFAARVAHGSILNGFLSHFVGMVLPGHSALLLSADLRYLRPSYAGQRLRLRGKVVQKSEGQRVLVLLVSFERVLDGAEVASGRVQVKVSDLG